MEIVKVYSPVEDKKIENDFINSPIWKQAYHAEDLKEAEKKFPQMFEYSFKFEGLEPVQFTGAKKVAR